LFYLEVYILFIILFPTIYKEGLLKKIRKKVKYTIYKFSVTLDDNGIEYATYTYRINIKWSSVTGIVETDRYLHVYTDSKEEIFIPKKIFKNDEEKNQFITELTNFSNNMMKKNL